MTGADDALSKAIPGASTPILDMRREGGYRERFLRANKMRSRERPFVAWDGEGITYPGETQQEYVLFGNSSGFSVSAERLGTVECLDLILQTEQYNPDVYHVAFAFSYDVEMILRDVPIEVISKLHQNGRVRWNGYYIEYLKKKWFLVSKNVNGKKVSAKIWDVFTFFQTSFVNSLTQYLGEDERIAFVQSGKQQRNVFQYDELETFIRPYWEAELALMVDLVESLRDRLYNAKFFDDGECGLEITSWHGPGAIATYAMTKMRVPDEMQQVVDPSSPLSGPAHLAVRHAYAGGRFEHFQLGMANQKVYGYDIRSAYPSVIRILPSMAGATWQYNAGVTSIPPDTNNHLHMAVYKIKFLQSIKDSSPMPLFHRDKRHAMHYPNVTEGWYWTPEARIIFEQYPNAVISGCFELVWENGQRKPFEWVNDVYSLRAQWKREGNPSELALKLLLNSMYGKFAQRVGGTEDKLPTFHQLEWAGYITSAVRAKLFDAMRKAGDGLVAVETDGIFTTKPIDLDIGVELGQWEVEEYDNIFYLQNGFYWKMKDGKWSAKTRGFDKDSINVDDAINVFRNSSNNRMDESSTLGTLTGRTTRFSTMGMYSRHANTTSRTWTTSDRQLTLGRGGKRIHDHKRCEACDNNISVVDGMHPLRIARPFTGLSFPHPLPWIADEGRVAKHDLLASLDEGLSPDEV